MWFPSRSVGEGRSEAGWREVALAGAPVVLVAVAWALRDTALYRVLTGEDAVLEWLQVAVLVAGAVVAVRGARRTAGGRRLVLGGLAAGLVVAVGEEVAWGGRLLDLSGTALQERNEQGETTLHNVGSGLEATFLFTAVAGAAGAVAALTGRLPGVPRAAAAWFVAAGVAGAARLVWSDPTYEAAKLTEATELFFYGAIAWVALGLARQAASPAAARFSFDRRSDSTVRSPRSSP